MADDLAAVRGRIHGVQQLDTVIGAMRGIAAAHAQQSRALLPGICGYADAIAQGIASALRLGDEPPLVRRGETRCARVVFSAEQGFVGEFVERVLDVASQRPPADLLLIGSRGLSLAAAHGVVPVWRCAMATQVEGTAVLCMRIADALYEIIAQRQIRSVELVFPVWAPGEGLSIACHPLLPLDAGRFQTMTVAMPPLSTLPSDVLLAGLTEEYVYATLCEAALTAFVAENEARAAAMVRARSKLEDMLADLRLAEHRVRQEAITAELLELVGGAAQCSRLEARCLNVERATAGD
jgi:F-type H+-transporting ATPase subunit gamma